MSEAQHVVAKGEFARLANVTPGRVSQWIAEGKIFGEALVGEGRAARIRVGIAQAQLRQKLDIGQRLGNGLGTRLDLEPPAPAAAQVTPSPPTPPVDSLEERIKRAKAEQLERANRLEAEDEAKKAGRYLDRDEARRQMTRIADQMLRLFEGALPELATAIGAKFELPQRDVLHVLKTQFRGIRERGSDSFRRSAETMPKLVEEEVPAEDAEAA